MVITREVINDYFCRLISPPSGNVMSQEGFKVLADWSEQQEWWPGFAMRFGLGVNWRSSGMGDPYNFALTLFRVLSVAQSIEQITDASDTPDIPDAKL
jgi:hypothetical protein